MAEPGSLQPTPHSSPEPRHFLFVTGRLAEPALRQTLQALAGADAVVPEIAVLPISVAALATTSWIGRHLAVAPYIERVYLPGLCTGDINELERQLGKPVVRGPDDLRDLPEALGQASPGRSVYGAFDF
jgi:hypothetical protein